MQIKNLSQENVCFQLSRVSDKQTLLEEKSLIKRLFLSFQTVFNYSTILFIIISEIDHKLSNSEFRIGNLIINYKKCFNSLRS